MWENTLFSATFLDCTTRSLLQRQVLDSSVVQYLLREFLSPIGRKIKLVAFIVPHDTFQSLAPPSLHSKSEVQHIVPNDIWTVKHVQRNVTQCTLFVLETSCFCLITCFSVLHHDDFESLIESGSWDEGEFFLSEIKGPDIYRWIYCRMENTEGHCIPV